MRYFQFSSLLTIGSIYILILLGGIVRSTGSGMGCPDWPKCFGKWIPPSQVSELPADYKTRFKVAGKEIANFNAFKTWVEYVNRLVGVLIGFFIFLTFLFSWHFWKKNKKVIALSFLNFILVGFQGWLGSVVVSTDLAPIVVTLHMLVAVLIVAILLYTYACSKLHTYKPTYAPILKRYLYINLIFILFQIILGTQIRESIDQIALHLGQNNRHLWIDQLGITFYAHRSFSILLFLSIALMVWHILKNEKLKQFKILAISILFITFAELILGTLMVYWAIPAFAQPLHLLGAILIFSIEFWLYSTIIHHKLNQSEK